MRDRECIAAVDQAQPSGREAGRYRIAIGAVGVEEELALAVLLETLLVDDRDRHLLAVPRREH